MLGSLTQLRPFQNSTCSTARALLRLLTQLGLYRATAAARVPLVDLPLLQRVLHEGHAHERAAIGVAPAPELRDKQSLQLTGREKGTSVSGTSDRPHLPASSFRQKSGKGSSGLGPRGNSARRSTPAGCGDSEQQRECRAAAGQAAHLSIPVRCACTWRPPGGHHGGHLRS